MSLRQDEVPVTRPNARLAAVQMISTPRVDENLATAGRLIAEAAAQGAQLVALPEYFPIMGLRERDKVAVREVDGQGPIQDFLGSTARRHGIWLVGGSMPLVAASPDKVLNSSLVFNPLGERVARYDKIHLFGFEKNGERYDESASIEPGTQPVSCSASSPETSVAFFPPTTAASLRKSSFRSPGSTASSSVSGCSLTRQSMALAPCPGAVPRTSAACADVLTGVW